MNLKLITELKEFHKMQQLKIKKDDQHSKIGGQATSWTPYRIDHCQFGEDRKIHQVHRRIDLYNSRIGKI